MSAWLQAAAGTPSLAMLRICNKSLRVPNPTIKTVKLKVVGVRCTLSKQYSYPTNMQVDTILHMNGAETDFSYANHSLSQFRYFLTESYFISKTFQKKPPSLQFFLNDLPGNDFNAIFLSLLPKFLESVEGFGSCCVAGVPGSFYGRLFPSHSLHLIYASHSLHFLSQVPAGLISGRGIPLNKRSVYITKSSPLVVLKAYSEQFRNDFTQLLKLRSEEMVHGGRMYLGAYGVVISRYGF
ncbi:hypothetical protein ACFE04_002323 [Oxalis oulophora]